MVSRRKSFRTLVLSLSALLAVFTGVAQAQNGNQSAAVTLRFQEAQSLRQALLKLAAANADYDGHRAKAMGEIKAALKSLDGLVMENGTAQQRTATAQGQTAVTNALKARTQSARVRENQVSSDELLQQAAQILNQVQATMATNKQQPKLVDRVNAAISEINTALKIR